MAQLKLIAIVDMRKISPETDVLGSSAGFIKFYCLNYPTGQIFVEPELALPKDVLMSAVHGLHIHENRYHLGKNGKAAGGHFDPYYTRRHEGPSGRGHLGDLPPVHFDAKTRTAIKQLYLVPRLTASWLECMQGYPVILHEGGDNFSDHPHENGGGFGRMFGGFIKCVQ